MPELTRRSPLEEALSDARRRAATTDDPGVTIAERRDLTLVQVMARRGKEHAVAERLGLDPAPSLAAAIDPGAALWLAPGAWMVIAEGLDEGALHQDLRERLQDVAAVVDQSHGRAVLRLSGRCARNVLAKGCRLDLHPRVFHSGMCAQTAIAQIGVLLHQLDEDPTYDLHVFAGYAADFLAWLTASAAEFGYEIEAP